MLVKAPYPWRAHSLRLCMINIREMRCKSAGRQIGVAPDLEVVVRCGFGAQIKSFYRSAQVAPRLVSVVSELDNRIAG
jgi:hypothetical protein